MDTRSVFQDRVSQTSCPDTSDDTTSSIQDRPIVALTLKQLQDALAASTTSSNSKSVTLFYTIQRLKMDHPDFRVRG